MNGFEEALAMHETPLSMDALRPWPDEARAEAFAQLARELRGFDKH